MPSGKCKQEGLHYNAFPRKKRHRHWTCVNEPAEILESSRATA